MVDMISWIMLIVAMMIMTMIAIREFLRLVALDYSITLPLCGTKSDNFLFLSLSKAI